MKPKPEFETPFESSLAEFEMAPLPPEWKKELIDNAVSAKGKATRFPSFRKIAMGAVASCWVVTGILHMTTPKDSDFPDTNIARNAELQPDDLPVLMAYFGRLHTPEINL